MRSKLTFAALALIATVAFTGCYNPKVDDAHLLLTPEEQNTAEKGVLNPQAGEVDVVEQVAAARTGYQAALEEMIAYYQSTGNSMKRKWAENELNTLRQMAQYRYLAPGEYVTQEMSATETNADADALYKQAMKYYVDAGGFFIVTSNAKFRQSLQSFNQLMQQYPNSTRIDEAAYRAGRIYEHFKDYELAAVMYQRCYQWNDKTSFPARFRAAYILDQKLKMRKEALVIYKLVVQKEARYDDNAEYARNRILELTKYDPSLKQEAADVLKK